ncbi:hypothetical protein [Saccharophagus degradans]|uniref:Uncharacterized protein n=1 Tax=Saccharophagus degradans (strain 2-40 / ATCC 43961 / DSM 17024) TaxID=203122 RepID=Q21JK6_SACD2|nr:hypothetical protein [Saccharophagus degradans]ABD81123.1 hypothetical protein Sde_1863 [Saccharophagus degradans 2-40]
MTDFSNNKAPTRSKWWLAYAVFIVFIELLGYSVLLRHPDAGVLEFLSVCFSVGLYAGLFGFALSKSIMTPVFWHAFLLVNIVYAHIYAYFGAIDLYPGVPEAQKMVGSIFSAVCYLPAIVALCLYGRKSDQAWLPNNSNVSDQ